MSARAACVHVSHMLEFVVFTPCSESLNLPGIVDAVNYLGSTASGLSVSDSGVTIAAIASPCVIHNSV